MYIGSASLEKLSSYIYGYRNAMQELGVKEIPEINFLEFSNWVRHKYNYPGSAVTAGWDKSILAITLDIKPNELDWANFPKVTTQKDHERSIQLFVELLNEYSTNK